MYFFKKGLMQVGVLVEALHSCLTWTWDTQCRIVIGMENSFFFLFVLIFTFLLFSETNRIPINLFRHFLFPNPGPFGERDDQQVFIQKVVPITNKLFVRLSSTGKR